MSRKCNTRHDDRGRSNYANRPGIYSHGHLVDLDTLRKRQARREEATGHPYATFATEPAE